MVGGEIEGFVLVKDGDNTLGILTHGDLGLSEGIRGALSLDLIDDIVVMYSQVLGDGTGFLPGKDAIQVLSGQQRAMCIMGGARYYRKAVVEILDEYRQISIGGVDIRNAKQAEFFDQTILEGLIGSFHPTFSLTKMCRGTRRMASSKR